MTKILISILLSTSIAHAGLFDDESENAVQKLYRGIENGDLQKIRSITTDNGYQIFSNPTVIDDIQKEIGLANRLKYKSRLATAWTESGGDFRKYYVQVSAKNDAFQARSIETVCKLSRQRVCDLDIDIPRIPDLPGHGKILTARENTGTEFRSTRFCFWETFENCKVNQ